MKVVLIEVIFAHLIWSSVGHMFSVITFLGFVKVCSLNFSQRDLSGSPKYPMIVTIPLVMYLRENSDKWTQH